MKNDHKATQDLELSIVFPDNVILLGITDKTEILEMRNKIISKLFWFLVSIKMPGSHWPPSVLHCNSKSSKKRLFPYSWLKSVKNLPLLSPPTLLLAPIPVKSFLSNHQKSILSSSSVTFCWVQLHPIPFSKILSILEIHSLTPFPVYYLAAAPAEHNRLQGTLFKESCSRNFLQPAFSRILSGSSQICCRTNMLLDNWVKQFTTNTTDHLEKMDYLCRRNSWIELTVEVKLMCFLDGIIFPSWFSKQDEVVTLSLWQCLSKRKTGSKETRQNSRKLK